MKIDPKQAHIATQWKHTAPLIASTFDPKGRYLFTSSEDFTLQRWELADGKKIAWPAHESWVRDIAVLPDGSQILSAGCDDKLIFWPAAEATPKPIRTVEAHKGWVRCLSLSADGKMVATGGNDNLVKLWSTADGKLIRQFAGHELNVYSTLIHPNGKVLLSGDQGGEILQWEIDTGKLVRKLDAKVLLTNNTQGVRYGGVRGLALSPDGKHLACCGLHQASNPLGAVNEPLVLQFEWESAKKVRSHVATGVKGIGWQVSYLKDGTLVCGSGGSGGAFLIFWKPDTDKEFHKLNLPSVLRDIDLHPDGLQIATAHHDSHARITKLTPPAPPKK